uniref:RING-type domain-containing protein n=1 Tax=Rhabditophanes sp. KR3021 TaxID=114890 RepID=A0AC35U5M2_9BILA
MRNSSSNSTPRRIGPHCPASVSSPALSVYQALGDSREPHDGQVTVDMSCLDQRDFAKSMNALNMPRSSSLSIISDIIERPHNSEANHATETMPLTSPNANTSHHSDSHSAQSAPNNGDESPPEGEQYNSFSHYIVGLIAEVYRMRDYYGIASTSQSSDRATNRSTLGYYLLLPMPFLFLIFVQNFLENYMAGIGVLLTFVSQRILCMRFVIKSQSRLNSLALIFWTIVRIFVTVKCLHVDFVFDSILFKDVITRDAPITVGDTIYKVLATDLLLIDGIIVIKMIVSMLPYIQQYKIRCMYQWIEFVGRLFGHFLPMAQWLVYFQSFVLCLLYSVLKLGFSIPHFQNFDKSSRRIISSTPFPSKKPNPRELEKNPDCGICFVGYNSPVELACGHIFCKECIATWLDKKDTCPLCRDIVANFNNEYKDGMTTMIHAIF